MRAVAGVIGTPPPRAFITALGDSNVQVRFHGWVDQREHDFQLVRSEAIRRVKTVFESAGMDLPEPIYRVQLFFPHPAAGESAEHPRGAAGDVLPQPAPAGTAVRQHHPTGQSPTTLTPARMATSLRRWSKIVTSVARATCLIPTPRVNDPERRRWHRVRN